MVVFTSLWPSNSCTFRMSYPSSSRLVANERPNVWQVARLVIPALATACLNSFCKMDSSRWCRPSLPVLLFFRRFSRGNTQCQRPLRGARILTIQSRRQKYAAPAVGKVLFMNPLDPLQLLLQRGALSDTGSIVIRSFAPLPSRTRISLRAKSISRTRKRRHSMRRSPSPYIRDAISRASPER